MLSSPPNVRLLGGSPAAELAQRVQVTIATIRYCSCIGLLDPVRNAENGYRCFPPTDLQRIAFIRQGMALTIGDIKSDQELRAIGEVPFHKENCLMWAGIAALT
jgi:DNA-binding transcriptional MerR regulator